MTDGILVIVNDVPIPNFGNSGADKVRKWPFNDMAVGDSFKFDLIDYTRVQRAAHAYGSYHSKRFKLRKEDSAYGRVWRTA